MLNSLTGEDEVVSKEKAYTNILEWLYVSHNSHESATEWRKKFVEMLKWNFERMK